VLPSPAVCDAGWFVKPVGTMRTTFPRHINKQKAADEPPKPVF
jgi:hypothetical protein